jgi:hypothetical protein
MGGGKPRKVASADVGGRQYGGGVLLPAIDWTALTIVAAGCTALSIVGALRRMRVITLIAVGLLALALLLAVLPGEPAPPGLIVFVSVCALAIAVVGGSPVSKLLLERTTFGEVPGQHGGVMAADGRELLRGGQMIGLLERLAVAGAIIAGYPDALAVIIAIKGVGRFNELENGAVRERFIVGTLVSWIWAAAAACMVLLARA